MHIRQKLLILLLLAPALATTATAQQVIIVSDTPAKAKNDSTEKKTITLGGHVYDSFTKAPVKALITLMKTDSTVVDTTRVHIWEWGTSDGVYWFKVPRRQAKYILKATCDGYEDTYADYEIKYLARNREFEVPRILMKKRADDDIYGEGTLDGVVVTGTRVKIAYKGDTVVYNAAAFKLPEGSMLDGLIRQMPGAELKDNGDIYVNGEKVENLTLNGKDFFKGNNKVMLDNLPYYTVQTVEVYNKSSRESEFRGREMGKKELTMDVKLKREYNRGALVNTEAGYGTDDRYLARLFGLYYTDHTRLSLFANTNNINEDRKPGYNGEWSPANMPQGLKTTHQTGLNFTTEDQDKTYEEQADVTYTWSHADNQTRTLNERFATDGNIMSQGFSTNRQRDLRLSAANEFMLKKPFRLWGNLAMSYSHGRNHSESSDSTFRQQLINESRNASLNRYSRLGLSGAMDFYHKLPWGDEVSLSVSGDYSQLKPSDSFSTSETHYAQTGQNDYRNYYNDNHNRNYNYSANAGYGVNLPNNWEVSASLQYKQVYAESHNSNYRLDWLGNLDDIESSLNTQLPTLNAQHSLGWLPSNDQLMTVLDADNSDSHIHLERTYGGKLHFFTRGKNEDRFFAVTLPLNHVTERMHYMQASLDTVAHRHHTDFEPTIMFFKWGKTGTRQLYYTMGISQPDFSSLMPTDDTTNPLALHINNPALKSRINHSLNGRYQIRRDSLQQSISFWASGSLTQRSWGTRTIYNPTTGAYTFFQDNINGNWNASLGTNLERPIDRKKRLLLSETLSGSYTHSRDFAIETLSAADIMPTTLDMMATREANTSVVNTVYLEDQLRLTYQYGDFTGGVSGKAAWRRSTSYREDFQDINAWDYSYGLNLKYTIPVAKIDVATDLTMFSRRGYNSSMMNTDDLVWNASLSRSFLKGKITARLMAFDILHQLSSTQYSVNAQGRTETWHNCIPRYALLTLAYKFQKMPKGKKQ